jgi:hypothetical protein
MLQPRYSVESTRGSTLVGVLRGLKTVLIARRRRIVCEIVYSWGLFAPTLSLMKVISTAAGGRLILGTPSFSPLHHQQQLLGL